MLAGGVHPPPGPVALGQGFTLEVALGPHPGCCSLLHEGAGVVVGEGPKVGDAVGVDESDELGPQL